MRADEATSLQTTDQVWRLIDWLSASATIVAFGILALALIVAMTGREQLAGKSIIPQSAEGLTFLLFVGSAGTVVWAIVALLVLESGLAEEWLNAAVLLKSLLWLAIPIWIARTGRVSWWLVTILLLLPASLVIPWHASPSIVAALSLSLCLSGIALLACLCYVNEPGRFFALKWFVLGAGSLFATEALWLAGGSTLSMPSVAGQGLINAVSAPMIAIAASRAPAWGPPVFISRQITYWTMAIMVIAFCVAIWFGLALFVEQWLGPLHQWSMMNLALIMILGLALILLSGSFRANVSSFIDTHFFANRYDYRLAWQQFTDGIDGFSETQRSATPNQLAHRLAASFAAIVGASGAALWRFRDSREFVLEAGFDFGEPLVERFENPALGGRLAEAAPVIESVDMTAWSDIDTAELPESWLTVPLVHQDQLFGVLMLAAPLHRRSLSQEDRELMRLMALQLASYLREEEAAKALDEARQFEGFNRRFAYVLHDLKNLSHELAITLDNAQRHRDNPAFYDALLKALGAMDGRLRGLIDGIRKGGGAARSSIIDLNALLSNVVAECRDKRLEFRPERPISVSADALKLGAVLRHVIDNALEASNRSDKVKILLREEPEQARIEVIDRGTGMSAEFVKKRLFKPFESTKRSGMGIGLVQAKSTIEAMGGSFSLTTSEGEGTRVTMTLPILSEPASAPSRGSSERDRRCDP